ncbi:MAG: glutaredoxin domain-containing protein [Candidatus Aminicenantales bacterium]
MDVFLFTYPNCHKCEELKNLLKKQTFSAQEFSLLQKESKLKMREYLIHIRRDEKGSIIIPTLVLQENSQVVAVMNSAEELKEWLRSKV